MQVNQFMQMFLKTEILTIRQDLPLEVLFQIPGLARWLLAAATRHIRELVVFKGSYVLRLDGISSPKLFMGCICLSMDNGTGYQNR